MDVLTKRADPIPSKVYDTYWKFAAERQAMYFRRLRGQMIRVAECKDGVMYKREHCGQDLSRVNGRGFCPHKVQVLALTADEILQQYRFTNVYRAADRVSQYLIRNVIYAGDQSPKEVIFRVLLFKIFNKISTWELLQEKFVEMGAFRILSNDLEGPIGGIPSPIERVFNHAKDAGKTLYSAAYVMPSPGNAKVKHRAHLEIIKRVVDSWHLIVCTRSLEELYKVLLAVESFGPFLAYQLAIDLNYSDVVNFDENEFVVPGPGARDGLKKCFSDPGGYTEEDLIRCLRDVSHREFERRGLTFETLFGRWPTLIDWQNVLCEISKYARVAHPDVEGVSGRTKIKQLYMLDSAPLPRPWFSPKWGINGNVDRVIGMEAARAFAG